MRVAISPCPNDTFAFAPLIHQWVDWSGPSLELQYEDIETLNLLGLSSSPPEILKFSYAIWPDLKKEYELCSSGSALGFGVGPLLVGQPGLSLEQRKEILVPGMKTTACLLTRAFAPQLPLKEVRYDQIFSELKAHPESCGVIIHESRFTYQDQGLELLLDLGTMWEDQTGGPLPLGGIAMHKSLSKDLKKRFSQALKASIQFAWQNKNQVIPFMQNHAQEMSEPVMMDHVHLYVNDYTIELGDVGRKAIDSLEEMNQRGH